MAVQAYWDEDFKVHSLKPTFKDENGLLSPLNVPGGDIGELDLGGKCLSLQLFPDAAATSNRVEIAVGVEDAPGVYEDGVIVVDLEKGFEMPTGGVKRVRITPLDNAMEFSFAIFKQ